MKLLTSSESRLIDQKAMEAGIPGLILMENAAFAITQRIIKQTAGLNNPYVLIICGKGNNGGDGLACARMLVDRGYCTEVIYLGDQAAAKGDALANLQMAKVMGVPILEGFCEDGIKRKIERADITIDALFGMGFHGEMKEKYRVIARLINQYAKYILSVDMPSGVDADTGWAAQDAIMAQETVSFGFYKAGQFLYPGNQHTGELSVAAISLPTSVCDAVTAKIFCLTSEEAAELLPERPYRSNKGAYGKACILAGSRDMPGAMVLCATAALKTGTGLAVCASVPECLDALKQHLPEAVLKPAKGQDGYLCDGSYLEVEESLKEASVIAIGPGIGRNFLTEGLIQKIMLLADKPIIMDADGLNIVARHKEWLKAAKRPVIITPHMKEMSRLTEISVQEIMERPLATAQDFAKQWGVITVLKDSNTIIATPEGQACINTTGNPAMAKGGSGDVLTGIIAGFISQGLEPFTAACLGVYLHGLAGDLAAEEIGPYGVLARDIADYLPLAMKFLKDMNNQIAKRS